MDHLLYEYLLYNRVLYVISAKHNIFTDQRSQAFFKNQMFLNWYTMDIIINRQRLIRVVYVTAIIFKF